MLKPRKQGNKLSIILGLIGIIITIILFLLSQSYRKPCLVFDDPLTINMNEIFELANDFEFEQENPSIYFTKHNINKKLDRNLTFVKFYFWNAGNKSIKNENILEDILIHIGNDNNKILETRILKESREVTNFELIQINNNEIKVKFDILEKNDGAACQVIYQGKSDFNITQTGTIEGVRNINNNIFNNHLKKIYFLLLIGFCLGELFTILALTYFNITDHYQITDIYIHNKLKYKSNVIIKYIILFILLVLVFNIFKNEISQFFVEYIINPIPESIRTGYDIEVSFNVL